MGKIHLEVVTPDKILVSQDVDIVVAPGSLGEFGVMEGHTAFLSGIVPGELRYTSDAQTEYFAVTDGFAEVSNDQVSVIVDAAERAVDIDVERASRATESRAFTRIARCGHDR